MRTDTPEVPLVQKPAEGGQESAWTPINMKLVPLLGCSFLHRPLWERINWLRAPFLVLSPLLALLGVLTTPIVGKTVAWAFLYYYLTGVGITAGYHRLFSHRAYKARAPLKIALGLLGSGAFEGSIRWWCRDHRSHHRFVDTPRDPYDSNQGFWYAHVGWMLVKKDPAKIGRADISDLNSDAFVRWQHRYFLLIAPIMAFAVPCLVAGLGWGDYRGGLVLAGLVRLVFVHHSTFCVNSLAHYWGEQAYTDGHTAKNSLLTAVLTLGEGYHNFHHEFPSDYRNAIRFYQYDPTKWLIRSLAVLGLAYDLQRFPENEIQMGRLQMAQKRLDEEKAALDWGLPHADLPVVTWEQVRQRTAQGERLLVLRGFVLDVAAWAAGATTAATNATTPQGKRARAEGGHPGGAAVLKPFFGKDITQAFTGGVYKHSKAAWNLTLRKRVARIADNDAAAAAEQQQQ